MKDIEYVIYVRKSTDESSEHQKQSIPDQIKACINFAEREWIKIKLKPKEFWEFESPEEICKEDNTEEISDRRIYQSTRNLFIIKEQKTWKIAGKRPKWRALIKLIKAWKVKWLISYSPDRQARNMLEWWEVIDCVDKWLIDLKYTNFHFEDTPSWKMMLGIWFVFSKQYSDKLSEDSSRWMKSAMSKWKGIWVFKHWYIFNENWYHEPHPKYFKLIKEAFKMKLDWIKEHKIKEFLDSSWYIREYKTWRESNLIATSTLNDIFKDSFYYGQFINWENKVDLRISNPYYQPVITEEEYDILMERYYKNPSVQAKTRTKDIYEDIKVYENWFITTCDDYWLTFTLPNLKRFTKKIEEANKKWIKLELKDVVKPHQIIYKCAFTESKQHWISITLEEIEKAVCKKFKEFHVWPKEHEDCKLFIKSRLDEIRKTQREKANYLNAEIERVQNSMDKYIDSTIPIKKDFTEEEKNVYEKRIESDKAKIKYLRKQIEDCDDEERDKIMELDIFSYILNNAEEFYKKTTLVQRQKIVKMFFLNIKIVHKKWLQVQVKPEMEPLFNPVWCQ